MNNYDRRWQFVLNWATKIKALHDTGEYLLIDNNSEVVPPKAEIKIDLENRGVYIVNDNYTLMLFEGNLEYDHGAYTPISELRKMFAGYQLYKKVDIQF